MTYNPSVINFIITEYLENFNNNVILYSDKIELKRLNDTLVLDVMIQHEGSIRVKRIYFSDSQTFTYSQSGVFDYTCDTLRVLVKVIDNICQNKFDIILSRIKEIYKTHSVPEIMAELLKLAM